MAAGLGGAVVTCNGTQRHQVLTQWCLVSGVERAARALGLGCRRVRLT